MNGFTEEQKKNLKVINKKFYFKVGALTLKIFLLLLFANFLVVFVDAFYVHSKVFTFVMSFSAGFCFSRLLLENLRILGDNLKADTLKILQNKE
jgi:putative flippase GtrA